MAIRKISTFNNFKNVVKDSEDVSTVTSLDPVTANAVIENAASTERVDEIMTDLEEKAEAVALETPESPEVKNDSIYSKKLILDESIEDFNIPVSRARDEDDRENEYLNYDMFDFVYAIVTEDWPRPKNPLNHPIRKFMYAGSDDYINNSTNVGRAQVSSDINGNVVVYANDARDFDDAMAVCDFYGIRHTAAVPKKSDDSYWNFSMTMFVPQIAKDVPMLAVDYFAERGQKLEDVIEDHKVGGGKTANWGKTHDNVVKKDQEKLDQRQNERAVKAIFDAYVIKAARSNDPLEDFLKDMFDELKKANLQFSKPRLKKAFFDEFNDDFED